MITFVSRPLRICSQLIVIFAIFFIPTFFHCSSSCETGTSSDSCPSGRYENEIYTLDDYPSDFDGGPDKPIEVTYGKNYSDDAMLWDNNAGNDDLSKVEDLKMDIYLPPPADTFKDRPMIVFVHGGGFVSGDKTAMKNYAVAMALRGWVTAAVNYRIMKKAYNSGKIFYAVQQEGYDVKAAVRWMKKHGSEYGADTKRIGVGGTSAGGFLSNEVGYNNDGATDPKENGEGDSNDLFESEGITSEVLAVMDKSGGIISINIDDVVDPGEPPALVIHCKGDPTVTFQDAIDFTEAMKKAGNFYHSDLNFIAGNEHGINFEVVMPIIAPFFTKYVAGKSVATLPTLTSLGVTTCPADGGKED